MQGLAARAEGGTAQALAILRKAADREDATEKHVVTPGPLVPARELLAYRELEAGDAKLALGRNGCSASEGFAHKREAPR